MIIILFTAKKNKGIYIYNVAKRMYGTLLTGEDEFKLIEYNNNELKYDEKSLTIKKWNILSSL